MADTRDRSGGEGRRERVTIIDVGYWRPRDLARIAKSGFDALNIDIETASADRLAHQAAGSPQLMQALCLYACFVLGTASRMSKRTTERLKEEDHVKACRLTSTIADFRSLVDALELGPRGARASDRKTYTFTDGTSLIFTDQNGNVSMGQMTSPTQVVATSLYGVSNLTGLISNGKITYSNGTVWSTTSGTGTGTGGTGGGTDSPTV